MPSALILAVTWVEAAAESPEEGFCHRVPALRLEVARLAEHSGRLLAAARAV